MKSTIEGPHTQVTLPELREPIDHANALLLLGLQLCLTEPVQEGQLDFVKDFEEYLSETTIPQEVVAYIVTFLESRMLNANPEVLRSGLETIYHALETRFWATRKVGALKAEHALPVFDPVREEAILSTINKEITVRQLPSELVAFFSLLMAAVRKEHELISQNSE